MSGKLHTTEDACLCLQASSVSAQFRHRSLGIDTQAGRYADVCIDSCSTYKREWLIYQFEMEGESRSGRWFRGLLATGYEKRVSVLNAAHVLSAMPWYFAGGSYFGGNVYRTSGPLAI